MQVIITLQFHTLSLHCQGENLQHEQSVHQFIFAFQHYIRKNA